MRRAEIWAHKIDPKMEDESKTSEEGQRGQVLYVTFSNINERQETIDLGSPDTPMQDK